MCEDDVVGEGYSVCLSQALEAKLFLFVQKINDQKATCVHQNTLQLVTNTYMLWMKFHNDNNVTFVMKLARKWHVF